MKILALDVSTASVGYALYDTDRHHSAIVCGAKKVAKKFPDSTSTAHRIVVRECVDDITCELIRLFKPDIAVIEQPLSNVGEYKPKGVKKARGQRDFGLGGDDAEPSAAKGGPNAATVMGLNQAFAVAYCVCRHKCRYGVVEVAPKTWQTITKQFSWITSNGGRREATTKERSIEFCKMMRIVLPDTNKVALGDAGDAACIAFWSVNHCQIVKRLAAEQAA